MKNAIVFILRHMPCNGIVYPKVLSLWKKIITPVRRRKLQRVGFQILGKLDSIFAQANVRYYVYWGTLLGMVREGGFLKNDDDIDISVRPDTFDFCQLNKTMSDNGFNFVHAIQTENRVLYYTYSFHGVHVDLFCEQGLNENGQVLSPVTRKIPGVHYDGFETSWWEAILTNGGEGEYRMIDGNKIRVPSCPESVLESMYGKGWRVPDPNFKGVIEHIVMPDLANRVTDVEKVLSWKCRKG